MNGQKIFELPYNFDPKLIDFLNIYFEGQKEENIHAIYFPPFKEDYIAAKAYSKHTGTNGQVINTQPNTREEYIQHILNIKNNFPNQLMLLLQQPQQILSNKLLNWYINTFNINKFCVGSIEQAKQIKLLNPTFEIIGSITMRIDKEQLLSNNDYEKYFDGFVLWFPFNRDINAIAELPKNFKYVLFVNGGCYINCPGMHHWFAKTWEEDQQCFKHCLQYRTNPLQTINIRPMDLEFFDQYITYYKIQGREWDTQKLIQHIVTYDSNAKHIYVYVDNYPELYEKTNNL